MQRKCQRRVDRRDAELPVALSAMLSRSHVMGHRRDIEFASLVRGEEGTGHDATRVAECQRVSGRRDDQEILGRQIEARGLGGDARQRGLAGEN